MAAAAVGDTVVEVEVAADVNAVAVAEAIAAVVDMVATIVAVADTAAAVAAVADTEVATAVVAADDANATEI